MGLNDTVFGSPGQTQVHQTAGSKPPGFNFARDFFNSLGGIAQNPYPTYQGQLDPGLSPSMQNILRQAQGYAQSGPPEILAGVQGSLGRFMNPNFTNPAARFGQGVPDYFNQNPNQTVYNGGTPGGLQGVFGAAGPAGMGGPKPAAGPSTGTIGGPAGQPGQPGQFSAQPGSYDQPQPMPGGKGLGGPGSDIGYQTPPYAGGGGEIAPINFDHGAGGGPLSFPGGQSGFQDFTKPQAGGGLAGVFGGGQGLPAGYGAQPPGGWGPLVGDPSGPPTLTGPPMGGGPSAGQSTYGGYSIEQLQHDPNLAGKLGPHAAALWRAFGGGQGGGGGMMPGMGHKPDGMHPLNPDMRPGQPMPGKPAFQPGMQATPPPVPGMQYGGGLPGQDGR